MTDEIKQQAVLTEKDEQDRAQALQFAATDPEAALEQPFSFIGKPWEKEVFTVAIRKDPVSAFRFAQNFVQHDWAGPLLTEAATLAPASALKYVKKYMQNPEHNTIIDTAAGVLYAAGAKEVCDKIYSQWKALFDPEVTYLAGASNTPAASNGYAPSPTGSDDSWAGFVGGSKGATAVDALVNRAASNGAADSLPGHK